MAKKKTDKATNEVTVNGDSIDMSNITVKADNKRNIDINKFDLSEMPNSELYNYYKFNEVLINKYNNEAQANLGSANYADEYQKAKNALRVQVTIKDIILNEMEKRLKERFIND